MAVHFIGAGPGDPELLTLRGLRLIRSCEAVLYAGSLVPAAIIAEASPQARVLDTSGMTLAEIIAEMTAAHQQDKDVARVHSGDPSLYGAIGEQMRALRSRTIPFTVTPGVPAFAAAAAALENELTLPLISQSVILTRISTRSSPLPEGESLASLGRSGATLAIHLAIRNVREVCNTLIPLYGADCPIAVVYRVSWPDQLLIRATLATIVAKVRPYRLRRSALILVGRVLSADDFSDSRLYSADHFHLLRPKKHARREPPDPPEGASKSQQS